MDKVEKAGRDKRESFKRLSESRLKQGKQFFKVLKNLGNPYNYSFTKEDLNHILNTIEVEIAELRKTYVKAMADPIEANAVDNRKGRPKRVRIPDSESTSTESVVKEILADATKIELPPAIITLDSRIDDLGLNVRSRNCLIAEEIETVGALIQKTEGELLHMDNLGRTSLQDIVAVLKSHGFELAKPKLPDRISDDDIPDFLKKKAI